MTETCSERTRESLDAVPEIGRIETARRRLAWAHDQLSQMVRRTSLPLLRFSLGVVFVWFGSLKVAGTTPVEALVAETMPWLDARWFVPALGWFEIGLGLALMVGYRLGWVCAAMIAHLTGTFLTVVMQPSALFQHGNPLLLTMAGEFVLKNLVLITAALVIASWPGRADRAGMRRPRGKAALDDRNRLRRRGAVG